MNKNLYKNFPFFELKSSDGKAQIKVCIYNYQYRKKLNDYYDDNWLMCYIEANCYGAQVIINDPAIETYELLGMLEDLTKLYSNEIDNFEFSSLEPTFSEFKFQKIDNLGHYNISGKLVSSNYPENGMFFEFETDQTYINHSIKQLKNVLKIYPVRSVDNNYP